MTVSELHIGQTSDKEGGGEGGNYQKGEEERTVGGAKTEYDVCLSKKFTLQFLFSVSSCSTVPLYFVELSSGCLLSVSTLKALCGIQRLSPDLFRQANFRPAKLLPSSPPARKEGEGEEVCLALQVNIAAYDGSLGQVMHLFVWGCVHP